MFTKYRLPVLLLAAFLFCMLTGCSKYDERSALVPALYFEKDGRSVLFSIVKYGKTVSYRSDGGSTYKQLSTNYFIQANDAESGELIANKKMMHSSKVKFQPVAVMGTANGKAWIFMNGLLAFDPFTLELFADKQIIADKNPVLQGKMPDEKKYYEYNTATGNILITATDGLKYTVSTTSLLATPIDEDVVVVSGIESARKALQKKQDLLRAQYDDMQVWYRAFNKLRFEKNISESAFRDSNTKYYRLRDSISNLITQVRYDMSQVDVNYHAQREHQRRIENLNSGQKSYTDLCTAVDSFHGKWFGLLSAADLEKPDTHLSYRSVNSETARNKLYQAPLIRNDLLKKTVEPEIGVPEKIHDAVYLQGGFLLNKTDALPMHLENEAGFIICSREKVGSKGNIILTRIDLKGNARWSVNTLLTEFNDWIFTGKKLIILANDNKEISSGEANLLFIIDLQTGKSVKHDYYTNGMRTE
ncbi:MAG: PA2928 family protein [Ferruginibacter sp.]